MSRRMFSDRITNSARFLKMPMDSQLLYFHLCMKADDDGIVEAFQVLRMTGISEDNLRVLVAKEYAQVLNKDLVTFINDWTEHNLIRPERKKDSIYKELLLRINPDIKLIADKRKDDSQRRMEQRKNPVRSQSAADCPHKLSKVKLSKDNIYTSSFDSFWSEYPRKVSKKTAFKSWVKIQPSSLLVKRIMTALEQYKQTKQWQDPQYIPHPSTWLNQARWEDEIKVEPKVVRRYS